MSQVFGRELPPRHVQAAHRGIARYLVVISSGGVGVARLFLQNREQVGEVDAGTEEIASMTNGLVPVKGASGPEWDLALAGHSAEERAQADVYTLST
jgi:hypothetical protein